MKNKRLRERVSFTTFVILTIGKTKRKFTETRDVSMNGLFIETEDPIPVGDEGQIELFLNFGESKKIIKSKFRVLRVVPPKIDKEALPKGFGVELFDFEGDSSEQLFNVIRYNRK